jgi:RNA polymerase sigma-70 factor, ECF subfamily
MQVEHPLPVRAQRRDPRPAGRKRRMRVSAAPIVDAMDPVLHPLAVVEKPELDEESRRWLDELRADGAVHDGAVARLHDVLLRAARFEVARRRPTSPHLRGDELHDIALEAADDALMSVLRRLDDFRGASRFSTWVYKFALLEAAVKLRKRAWQGREVPLEQESWDLLSSAGLGPADAAEQSELIAALQDGIAALTPHQRRILVALAVNGIPIDVLADRLNTNRGALYKTLHDARRNLRAYLTSRGFDPVVSFEESH